MEINQLYRFMSMSYLYFLMNEKDSNNISEAELTDLVVAINDKEGAAQEAESYLV